MALKEDKEAFALLHEGIDTCGFGARQHAITGRRQGVLRQLVPPGVWHTPLPGSAGGQGVLMNALAVEHTEPLDVEPAPLDTVDVQDCRMGRQARADG
jgi:hypothetical protein